MLSNLQSYVQSPLGPTHDNLLMWDVTSTLQDPNIQTFRAACQLHNLHSQCISAIPINTSVWERHVDFLLSTTLHQTSLHRSRILNFNDSPQSNHRALLADFDEQALFQGSTTDPMASCQRLLRLNNPFQCKTYLTASSCILSSYEITKCSNHLGSLLQAETPASIIFFLYNALDRHITKGLLHAEQKSVQALYRSQ